MTRLVRRPIPAPERDPAGAPRAFVWRGRRLAITAVLESWRDAGLWWEGEVEKTFWRVQVADGGIYELWEDATGRWAVYRVWD